MRAKSCQYEGNVNWAEVQAAFREIGYQGAATVELRSGGRDYLVDLAQRVDRQGGSAY
jgi:sugar phosphate isomerase/epimerase